jgi:hypothetical protein
MEPVEKKYRTGAEVQGVAGEVRQVFSNLIANAIDALAMNGRLMLRIAKSQTYEHGNRPPGVRVSIADNGSGISPHDQQRLFQPFFTTKDRGGTGLGLWVSKGIIERHGGSIQTRSSIHPKGHGTVFSIFLPKTYQGQTARYRTFTPQSAPAWYQRSLAPQPDVSHTAWACSAMKIILGDDAQACHGQLRTSHRVGMI